MDNLSFYQVNMKYIRDLSAVDDKVMSVSPQTHKETRPFLGIIIICGEKPYCIPLTSPKPKHINMKNREDFSRIIDSNGKIIGSLNFNNMIPVSREVITPLNIVINENDSYAEQGRKKILNVQLDWCNTNKEIIFRKANKLYHLVVDTPNKMRNLTRRCCDFKKLETVLEKYLEKNTASKSEKGYIIEVTKEQLAKLQSSGIPFKKAVKGDKIAIKIDYELKDKVTALLNNSNMLKP